MEDVFGRNSRAYHRRHRDCATNGFHFFRLSRMTRRDAGYYHTVNEKKLCRLRCFNDIKICSNRVRRVFLFHVSKNPDMVCSHGTSISQQGAGACFDQPFIGYMCEHEALNTHKARTACERNPNSAEIRASEYLDAKRQRYRSSYFRADDRHGGGDLRTDAAFQVWAIMRVLNHHGVESCILVFVRLFHGNRCDGRNVELACRCAWQCPKMNNPDEDPSDAKQRVHCSQPIHRIYSPFVLRVTSSAVRATSCRLPST